MHYSKIPEWLFIICVKSILFKIYHGIRAISIGIASDNLVLIKVYIDHEPTGDDNKNISLIMDTIIKNTPSTAGIVFEDVKIIHQKGYMKDFDALGGFIYARREYVDD